MKKLLMFALIFLIGCTQNVKENITKTPEPLTIAEPLKVSTTKVIKGNFYDATYLTGKLWHTKNPLSNPCKSFYSFSDKPKDSNYSIDLLNSETVKNNLKNILGSVDVNKFLDTLSDTIQENNIKDIFDICTENNEIYVIFAKDYFDIFVASWETSKFVLSESFGALDYNFTFVPQFEDENHLIYTGYGDAGSNKWSFLLLNSETQKISVVEDCNGHLAYEKDMDNLTGDFEFSCKKEYPNKIDSCSSSDSTDLAQCYWNTAMENQNLETCSYLESTVVLGEPEYATKENCEKSLSYKTENAQWNLAQGIPPYADPSALIYRGKAKLTGWLIYKPFYIGADEAHFHVTDESAKDLPFLNQKSRDFYLISIPSETVEKLKDTNEKNPATVEVDEILFKMEGSPSFKSLRILN